MADFLPASLGTIVSYLTAEVTRGTWKPASMNGTDWPCPDANLSYVEEKINTIVAASAVDVSSTSSGLLKLEEHKLINQFCIYIIYFPIS